MVVSPSVKCLCYAKMMVCSPISTCVKNVIYINLRAHKQSSSHICYLVSKSPSTAQCFSFHGNYSRQKFAALAISEQRGDFHSSTVRASFSFSEPCKASFAISSCCHNMKLKVLAPKQGMHSDIRSNLRGFATVGFVFGLLVCHSSFERVYAEAAHGKDDKEAECDSSFGNFSHGKKVYTDFSITGIPGDGRCLFRSVAHGACLRSGKAVPSETLQRELADELRARVADEFIKRREETEWFIEGDFDRYISRIRKPHVWGGEPELLMASHVLRMPITVYMYDKDRGGLITIAEYGQEYGKENPIRVLYHGFGHYDALQIPAKDGRSRL